MKKFLSLAFILAFTQSVGASDSFDMDPETQRLNEIDAMVQKVRTQCNEIEAINQKQRLISQVRAQCGNATEFDQYRRFLESTYSVASITTIVVKFTC